MKKIISVILCSVFIFTLTACSKTEVKKETTSTSVVKEQPKEETPTVATQVQTPEVTKPVVQSSDVLLYFSDDQAMYLVGEKRTIENPTAKSIVSELVKGPSTKSAVKSYATLPTNLEVLDVQVKEKIAYVDLKTGLKVEGSAGENMALYSIINTLIEYKELGITKVQFLVNGKNVTTMGGQTDVSMPFVEKNEMMKK
ncbi:MAG TPA: GerMN domain-containing protein [Clostridium sp.]|uniref:GerMN domain-containing protein n=1 Tax=Clostridium sp. TaxID=1506 RepID=UPI002F93A29E